MTLNLYCLFVFSRREAEAAAMAAAVEKQKVTDRYMNSPRPLPHNFLYFSSENLVTHQDSTHWLMNFYILLTCLFNKVLKQLRETRC